mgnify:CR=1 FL=1
MIPRSKLPEVLDEISNIGKKHGLTVANVFHAGDGNLHPLILYNYENPDEERLDWNDPSIIDPTTQKPYDWN